MKSKRDLWSGRFRKRLDPEARAFSSSPEDAAIARHDIIGSIAHAMTLRRAGIISERESVEIVEALRSIYKEVSADAAEFLSGEEDVHMAVERRLTSMSPAGPKLHTARSRNDQIALDLRLYVRENSLRMMRGIISLQKALLRRASGEKSTVLPGYTHLQHAQPVYLSHHLLAHFNRLERDFRRIASDMDRNCFSPLGACAIAGTSHGIDVRYSSSLLGFPGHFSNSIDATSDRDFVLDACYSNAVTALHLSSMAEEFILWSSAEFSFIDIPDELSTGSSIMPHKKNPDMAEHIRGLASRPISDLSGVATILHSLPLGYASDLQHVKRYLFDSFEVTSSLLSVASSFMSSVRFNRERMREAASDPLSYSVEIVDQLVQSGMAFREAHELVGRAVLKSLDTGKALSDVLSQAGVRANVPSVPEESVEMRGSEGGSSLESIRKQMRRASSVVEREGRELGAAERRYESMVDTLLGK